MATVAQRWSGRPVTWGRRFALRSKGSGPAVFGLWARSCWALWIKAIYKPDTFITPPLHLPLLTTSKETTKRSQENQRNQDSNENFGPDWGRSFCKQQETTTCLRSTNTALTDSSSGWPIGPEPGGHRSSELLNLHLIWWSKDESFSSAGRRWNRSQTQNVGQPRKTGVTGHQKTNSPDKQNPPGPSLVWRQQDQVQPSHQVPDSKPRKLNISFLKLIFIITFTKK